MLLSLAELPHSSVPVTSTPNKLTNRMTSMTANRADSTGNEDVKSADSGAAAPDDHHRLLDSSSVIESRDGSVSDFNTTGENALSSDWRDASCGVTVSLTSRIPSPSGGHVLPGVAEVESRGCEDEEKEKSGVTGYTRCQNGTTTSKAEGLKKRLLSALAKLIPHEESLSLQVLVNYTIDGADSECLVIDETLRRQLKATGNGESGGETMKVVSGSVRRRNDSGTETPDNKRRKRLHQSLYMESPVLDLSRQDSGLSDSVTSLMRGDRGVAASEKSISMEMPNGGLRTTAPHLVNGSSDYGKSTLANSEGNITTNGMSMLDPSVFALLPFLHQLQQQQEKLQDSERQVLLQQQEKEQKNTSQTGDTSHAGQSEGMYPDRRSIKPELTSENLLLKHLQALVDSSSGNSNAATGSINDGTNKSSTDAFVNRSMGNTNLAVGQSSVDNIAATLLNGNVGIVSCGSIGLNSTGNTVTNSVVGLPFLNAFNTDQLSALLSPTSFLSQSKSGTPSTVTVNSIIGANAANRPSLLNGIQQQQQGHRPHEDNGRSPAAGFTSVNLGSATLLNLRDKMTGMETLGILPVPGNRSFTQPMTSLLNHFCQNTQGMSSVPASTTPVPLQKLSSFSYFLNSLANTSLVPTQPSSSSSSSSTPVSTSATTVPLASTSAIPSNVSVASTNPFSFPLPLSLPLPLSRATLLPTNLSNPASMEPTTLLTMLPNISATNDVVNMLNSLNNVGSLERNQLMTLQTLNAAVDRMKNQMPIKLDSGDVRKLESDTGRAPITKSLDTSGFVNSPGSAGESHDSSPSSANNLMFGRRLINNRRFICNQCRKNYTSLAELNRHTLEAHSSFKCTICSAHFTQRSNLQRHSLKHVGFKPFTCNLCKKEYYRKDHLVRHIEVTHPNHDPKMNITVHLTSSECLEYLDRINTGKQTPSPGDPETLTVADLEMTEEEYLKIEEGTPEESGAFHTESSKEEEEEEQQLQLFQSVVGAGESLSPAQ